MTRRYGTIFPHAMGVALAAIAIQAVPAQPVAFPPIQVSTRFVVKADRSGDLAAAIKEYNAVLKKAQWDKRITIWHSATGPTEMMRDDFYDKWADLDTPISQNPKLKEYQADLVRITRRITDSFESSTRVIAMVDRQASTPRPAEVPKMIMLWTAHVMPGKMAEAVAAERNEYAPAAKSVGIQAYVFTTTRFGGPNNEIRSSMGLDKWADLEEQNPIRKAMGDERYRAFSEKMNTLLEDYHYDIYRYDPELSYTPGK